MRTIRFWSDEGILPPSERSAAGYRRYDAVAVARLDLVRTLRDLGMGLDDVREVITRRHGVAEVAWSLPRTRPGFRTFVAGPGWTGVALPPNVVGLLSLPGAVAALGTAVRP